MKKKLLFLLAIVLAFAFAVAPTARVTATPTAQSPDCAALMAAETIANADAIAACTAGSPGGPSGVPASPYVPEPPLYDNGSYINAPGAGPGGSHGSVVQTALGLTVFGIGSALPDVRVADDFTVPAGAGWQVDSFTFFAYQSGSTTTSTINHVNYRIWDGPPGATGSSVVYGDTTTNRITNSVWHNAYRYSDTTPSTTRPVMATSASADVTLLPGTYWLDWQMGGTLASGPWVPPITINGQTTTGNAWQFVDVWYQVGDSGFPQGLPFIVKGLLVSPTSIELGDFDGHAGGFPTVWLLGLAGLALIAAGLIARRQR